MSRPVVSLIAGIGAAAAVLSFDAEATLAALALAFGQFYFLASGGFVLNDVFDVEQDRINDPGRPLVAGAVTPGLAAGAAMAMFGMSIAFAAALAMPALVLDLFNVVLLTFYSPIKKAQGLAGNLVVSYLCVTVVLLGGVVAGRLGPVLAPAAVLFGFVMIREIVADVHDVRGDRAAKVRTLAVTLGCGPAFLVAWSMLGATVAGVVLLAMAGGMPVPFAVAVGAALALLGVSIRNFQRDRSGRNYDRYILVGRAAFLIGAAGLLLS